MPHALTLLLAAMLPVHLPAPDTTDCPPPRVFEPGKVSLPTRWEWRWARSPTGDLAAWNISDDFTPLNPQSTIVLSERRDGHWSPEQVAPFSGQYDDLDAFFSLDGKSLFFSSDRPTATRGRGDFDLWRVDATATGWGEPVHLGNALNSGKDELYPSVDREGTLYFGSNRDGQFDVWRSRRGSDGRYGAPERLGAAVNSADYWEFNPEISPDGQTLLFVGLHRPDGYGLGDIYASHRRDDGFSPAINLGPCVNSPKDDFHPSAQWQEGQLVFERNPGEPGRKGDFLVVPLPAVAVPAGAR